MVGNSKFFRLTFALANCWITFLKSKFLAFSFSIDSRAKSRSLSWDMELRRKFFISLSLEKDLSTAATVTDSLLSYTSLMPYKCQNKLWQVMHFQHSKKSHFFRRFKLGNLFSKRRFGEEHLVRKQRRDVIKKFVRKFSCFNLKIQMRSI